MFTGLSIYDILIRRLHKRTWADYVKVIRGKRFVFNIFQYTNVGKFICIYA